MSKKNLKHHPQKKKKKSRFSNGLPKISDKDRKMGKIYIAIIIVMAVATAILVLYGMS